MFSLHSLRLSLLCVYITHVSGFLFEIMHLIDLSSVMSIMVSLQTPLSMHIFTHGQLPSLCINYMLKAWHHDACQGRLLHLSAPHMYLPTHPSPAKFSLRSRYAHSQQGEPVQNDLVASQGHHRRQIDIDM